MSMKTSNDTIGIRPRDVWQKCRGLKFSNFVPFWKNLQHSLSVTFSCSLPISQLWYDIYEICVMQRTPWFDLYCLALVTCCRTGPRYERVTHIAFVFSLFVVHKPGIELGLLRNVWLQLNSKLSFQELPYLEAWRLGFKELWKCCRALLWLKTTDQVTVFNLCGATPPFFHASVSGGLNKQSESFCILRRRTLTGIFLVLQTRICILSTDGNAILWLYLPQSVNWYVTPSVKLKYFYYACSFYVLQDFF
jgi:hypothetical protein